MPVMEKIDLDDLDLEGLPDEAGDDMDEPELDEVNASGFIPTHKIRGIKVVKVYVNEQARFYDCQGTMIIKGGKAPTPIMHDLSIKARKILHNKAFTDDGVPGNVFDLSKLLSPEDFVELERKEREPTWEEIEFTPEQLGLCLEAVKYSRATNVRGDTAVIVDKDHVRLSVYKGVKTGGCTHYLMPLPEKIKLRVQVLEW